MTSLDVSAEVTAKYIWDNQKWLENALQVYEAMPTIRDLLAQEIMDGAKQLLGEAGYVSEANSLPCVGVRTVKDSPFSLRAELELSSKGSKWLYLACHVDQAASIRAKERKRVFEAFLDGTSKLDGVASGDTVSNKRYAWIYLAGELRDWNSDGFLRGAILRRAELKESLSRLLCESREHLERALDAVPEQYDDEDQ